MNREECHLATSIHRCLSFFPSLSSVQTVSASPCRRDIVQSLLAGEPCLNHSKQTFVANAEKFWDRVRHHLLTSRSDVIPAALLQLDQSPASGLRVVHILWQPRDTDRISDLLHLVLHTRSELATLLVTVNMHLLSAAHDDKHRNLTRLEHPRVQHVDVPDIQDLSLIHI